MDYNMNRPHIYIYYKCYIYEMSVCYTVSLIQCIEYGPFVLITIYEVNFKIIGLAVNILVILVIPV